MFGFLLQSRLFNFVESLHQVFLHYFPVFSTQTETESKLHLHIVLQGSCSYNKPLENWNPWIKRV